MMHAPHRHRRRLTFVGALTACVTLLSACALGGTGAPVTVTVTRKTTGGAGSATPGQTGPGQSGGSSSDPDAPSTPSAGLATNSPAPITDPSHFSQSTQTPSTTTSAPPTDVHVSTFEGDGETYGIGMAVMALFSVAPTDPSAFDDAATVTVNGKPANGAWFWQQPTVPGYAMEALYRGKKYWPAHAAIHVDLPVKGLSAGEGLAYDDNVTVDFQIGDAHISHVDNKKHAMVVTNNGKVVKNFPVSLGSATHPTYDGVKVVMAKHNPVEMKSEPGAAHPYDVMVPWSVRITNSGEFVHAASWNTGNIGSRNTSHGCTNLDVGAAKWFYQFSRLGDIVDYPHANPSGTVQPSWDGWGWWNVPWSQWQRGGALRT